MPLYTYLYQYHSGFFTFPKQYLCIIQALLSRYVMRAILLTFLAFFFIPSHAQENTKKASDFNVEKLSDAELLKKAKSLQFIDPQISQKLANEALRLAETNNHDSLSAQAHVLLAKVAYQSKDIDLSLQHFSQASLKYKNINDTKNQIRYSINYIDILLDNKRYEQADKVIDELLPIALQYGDALSVGLALMSKGSSYYKRNRYKKAIQQYTRAIKYLSGDDKTTLKNLGETYKIIAQSYKRLENREKTTEFYKKTLKVYTSLQDKKLIAHTLNSLAESERYLGNLVIALEYSLRGLEIHSEINDPLPRARALAGAGIIYRHLGRYEKSLSHINEAHLYYKKVNNINGIAETSNQLGYLYTRLEQFDMARSFYQLSVDLPGKKIKQSVIAAALRELAVIDLNAGDYESAMQMAKKAHKIYQRENNKLKQSRTARVIGNIYRTQKDTSNAIVYYKESLLLATDVGNKIYQIKAQTALAGVLIGINTKEAINLLKKSLDLSTKINNKPEMLYAYRNFRKAEKLRGNLSESLRYAEEEIKLTKLIQQEKDDNNFSREKANVHSFKMEAELISLKEKARLDQLKLAKKNNEIEISDKTRIITELQLIKNKYASITLALLLAICLLFIVLIYRRFIASKKRNRELDYLAARDPLTNSYNRRVLFERMEQDFKNTETLDEYCIIMADIDHFKDVNDIYGHTAGDSIICNVANILQGCVRQHDIVARYGGEEFCIVLHRVPKNQAMQIAETMRSKVEKSRINDILVTCSFGVTSIKFNASTVAELIDQADLALYKSKSLGRNQVTLWGPILNHESKRNK